MEELLKLSAIKGANIASLAVGLYNIWLYFVKQLKTASVIYPVEYNSDTEQESV